MGGRPASSWPPGADAPVLEPGVAGLPRSWQRVPSITARARGRSRPSSSMRPAATSTACSVWTHTSPSGCQSGSWGVPWSGTSSGATAGSIPQSRIRPRPIDGRRAFRSSFSISPKTRSAGSSRRGMEAHSAAVAGSTRSSKRAASWTARSAAGDPRRSSAGPRPAARGPRGTPGPVGVQDLPRRGIQEHRVQREVPAPRGLGHVEPGVEGGGDPAMARAALRVATRQGPVDGAKDPLEAADLVDREGLPHQVHAADAGQRLGHLLGGEAVDLHVEVVHGDPEERVAHGAAHDVGPSARRAQRLDHPGDARRQAQLHGSPASRAWILTSMERSSLLQQGSRGKSSSRKAARRHARSRGPSPPTRGRPRAPARPSGARRRGGTRARCRRRRAGSRRWRARRRWPLQGRQLEVLSAPIQPAGWRPGSR